MVTRDLDYLANLQREIGEELRRLVVNYKKDGESRKGLDYLQKRLNAIDQEWDCFEANDNEIRDNYSKNLDHAYFADGYYEAVRAGYEQMRDDIMQRIDVIKSRQATATAAGLGQPQGLPSTRSNNDDHTIGLPTHANANGTQENILQPLQPSNISQGEGLRSLFPEGNTAELIGEQPNNGNTIPVKHTSKPQTQEVWGMPTSHTSCKGAIPKAINQNHTTIDGHNISMNAAVNSNISGLLHKQQSILNRLQVILAGLLHTHGQSQYFYKLKIQTLERYLQEAQLQHQEIWEQIADPATAGYDSGLYFTIEEQTINAIIQLQEQLNNSVTSTQPQQTNTQSQDGRTAQASSAPMIKLPKIVLPKFDGDYIKWRQFSDLFKELVHNQPIANCQKMWYLKTSLSGEAEKLIRHLTTSDANYSSAWKIINDRFENVRLITSAYLNKLLSQPMHTVESASAIKSLHDTTLECLHGLQNLGVDTNNWDPFILHILLKRLDKSSHTIFEQTLKEPRQLPSLKEFLTFLEMRFQSLEALGNKGRSSDDQTKRSNIYRTSTSAITTGLSCTLCKGNHRLFACQKFLKLTPSKRLDHIKQSNLCINCLGAGHDVNNCTARTCTKCTRRHNTLLHMEASSRQQKTASPSQQPSTTSVRGASILTSKKEKAQRPSNEPSGNKGYVFLSTVLLKVTNHNGISTQCTAILDSGSQLNFITKKMVKKLQLSEEPANISIEGIAQQKRQAQRRVNINLQSLINGFTMNIEAHVLPNIISAQPTQKINITDWAIPNNIVLADPDFNSPKDIDLLIGAELYFSLLAIGQIKLGEGLPTLQNTVFGWTVSGKLHQEPQQQIVCGICSEDESLDKQLTKFWQLEETESPGNNFTAAERRCETFFNNTTQRQADGRFVVRLPFSDDPATLGESKDIAYQRFLSLERKFTKHPELKQEYVHFMEEYIRLGHMEEVNFNSISKPYYFLPHHCVVKPDSSTTKLRVVFDGSAKTSSNVSLNDILSTGPTLQDDIFSILLRFRMPRFVFTADIEKMYRQVIVDQQDRKYQLIWWRNEQNEHLKCFQLRTVTYGTTSAPYLATKCLQRLADEHSDRYSMASEVLRRDFYVDDLLTGSDNLSTAREIQHQLQTLLKSAGFNLRKWCANHPRLLEHIPLEEREVQLNFDGMTQEHVKTVGLIWLPATDEFRLKANLVDNRKITKRTVCSDIAHLFDPLGIMSPVVVIAKVFLQRLWLLKLDWDAALPQESHTFWDNFREGLKKVDAIKFPRHIHSHRIVKTMQLHVFADASEKAFGAAAYVRSSDKNNIITVRLLCAKSRVAPIAQKATVPRLELCAATLAAELAHRIKNDLQLQREAIYLWSDSEVVLNWINSTSSSYPTFVANRISRIQQISIPIQWRHVDSKNNPADILSRGLTPEKLATSTLWFYGPLFLHGSEQVWPAPFTKKENVYDPERILTALSTTTEEPASHLIDMINHGNSFKKLQRIMAYILRFITHTRRRNININRTQALTAQELAEAEVVIIRKLQEIEFKDDIIHLQRHGIVNKHSQLCSLTPFLDHEGMMRVGGRLEASNLSYEAKHPALLPYNQLTKLLLKDIHKENHHAGPQTIISIARQRYWPMKGKTLARSVVQNCVSCARARPKLLNQIMGNLPADRVQPARPFMNAGVDFAGPIWTHYKLRGKRPQKTYIAVFCCFATKAAHLEVVTDLTTQGFIGSLKRFMGRRGHCANLYCDNATNFVGAKNELDEVKSIIESRQSREQIISTCSKDGTNFHFIPPRAPHFGGLWEAAVKSAKHLLRPILAKASLTYEELETVVIEIEAILNSRPITPMSSNPNDLTALTPGHFLIGEPLTSKVDCHAAERNVSLLKRWELVTQTKNEFWQRWLGEYLNHLQHRYKWKQRCQNIEPGMMVIIKEDNVPPLKWPLARVVKIFKAEDGLVRVADLRTSTGIVRRVIHRLAPLPTEGECSNKEITQTETGPAQSTHTKQRREKHDTRDSRSKQESARKRTRLNSMGTTIAAVLLTLLVLPSNSQGNPVEIQPFNSKPGIYFENLGPANIIASEWTLIAYYDMMPFWKEFQSLTNCSHNLDRLCKRIKEHEYCQKIVNHFQHMTKEWQKNNELLLPTNIPGKTKRGAINFVGNVANALFGVLDSEYATQMSKTIADIKENEDYLHTLLKNQTSILDATINIMRKDQETIKKQFDDWETHIDHLLSGINAIKEEVLQEKLSNAFTSLAMQAMLTASNFDRIQSAILDVLIDTHHGRISPKLITPDQIKQELIKIKNHLITPRKLPAPQGDVLQFYNLMTIKGRPTSTHIIFKLSLPLLDLEDFELFHIVPVPVSINNTFLAIQPSSPYLIINLHRDQYYSLSKVELQSCIITSKDKHICRQEHPIFRKGSAISACEIDFLNHLPPGPSCAIVNAGAGPHWIQLHNPNKWIYAMKEKTTINVVCANTANEIEIKESGVLSLQEDCVIKQQLITIRGHKSISSTIYTSYVPAINLTESVNVNVKQAARSLLQHQHYQPHYAELESIKQQLHDLNTGLPKTIQSHDTHHFLAGYISLFLIICVLIFVIWRYRLKFRHKANLNPATSNPVPKPRKYINQQATRSVKHQQTPEFQIDFEDVTH